MLRQHNGLAHFTAVFIVGLRYGDHAWMFFSHAPGAADSLFGTGKLHGGGGFEDFSAFNRVSIEGLDNVGGFHVTSYEKIQNNIKTITPNPITVCRQPFPSFLVCNFGSGVGL